MRAPVFNSCPQIRGHSVVSRLQMYCGLSLKKQHSEQKQFISPKSYRRKSCCCFSYISSRTGTDQPSYSRDYITVKRPITLGPNNRRATPKEIIRLLFHTISSRTQFLEKVHVRRVLKQDYRLLSHHCPRFGVLEFLPYLVSSKINIIRTFVFSSWLKILSWAPSGPLYPPSASLSRRPLRTTLSPPSVTPTTTTSSW